MSFNETDILGTKITLLSKEELNGAICDFLNGKTGHYIVTPNPEIVLMAKKDRQYQEVLNQADISIADGFGLVLAGFINGTRVPRHTGSGITTGILAKAEAEGLRVMVINLKGGWSPAPEIKKALKTHYPKLVTEVIDVKKEPVLTEKEVQVVKEFEPVILFTTVGIPVQEKIISKYLKDWPSVRLALGVGGTFDLLTGKAKKAPKIMSKLGLEWLWRVIINPKRITRTGKAIPTFLWQVTWDKVRGK
jgi:N-acetylglucosaminyldiphosphoundecaprenol N-acetyl-beta-D-mannosaminyltransferase